MDLFLFSATDLPELISGYIVHGGAKRILIRDSGGLLKESMIGVPTIYLSFSMCVYVSGDR